MNTPNPTDCPRQTASTRTGLPVPDREKAPHRQDATETNTAMSRRTVLRAAAGLSVGALAGCSGGPGTSPSPDTGPFDSVTVEGLKLVITLTESATIDRLNVIAPTGKLFAQRSIATGVQTVSFELGTAYSPGEFRILAIRQEETVAETTFTIRPEWQITEFGLGANHPEEMPENVSQVRVDDEAFLTIANQGTGPGAIEKLLILGDVPNPTTDLVHSGMRQENYRPLDKLVVKPNESRRVYTNTISFRFVRDGNVTCQPESQTGTFEVVLEAALVDRYTKKYSIQYSGAETYDGCTMTVQEANQ